MPFEFKDMNFDTSRITPDAINAEIARLSENSANSQAGFFRIRTANQCIQEAKTQPIPRNLYQSLMFEGEITVLFADTGVGKSIFAVQVANEISKTDKVLYFDLELSDKQFQNRYSDNYKNEFIFNENFFRHDFVRPFTIPDGYTYDDYFIYSLKEVINNTGAKIIIIDNMTKLISGDTDGAKSTKPLMDVLTAMKFEHGLTMLLLEHTRKTDTSRPISLNDLQGSKMKANFTDAAFSIGRSSKDKNLRYIKQLKCRSCEAAYDSDNIPVYEIVKENSLLQFKFLNYDTEYNHLRVPSENDKSELLSQVKQLRDEGHTVRDIAKTLNISKSQADRLAKRQVCPMSQVRDKRDNVPFVPRLGHGTNVNKKLK